MVDMESRATLLQPSVVNYQREANNLTQDDSSSTSFLRPEYQRSRGDDRNAEKLSRPSASIYSILLDILLCVVALCFLALAGLAVWMKNRPTGTTLGNRLEDVMKLGPTIYPIIFAALLSRALKSIGLHTAQKGTVLKSLWTLMNTNSVSDSFSHVLTVPKSLLVWCLIFTWALSPLGGQGSLRLMHRFNSDVQNFHGLRYWDNGPLGNLYAYQWVWVSNDGAYPLSMRDIYTAGLMQSTKAKTGPLDQFGNVKIPRLPDAKTSSEDSDGWFPITRGDMRPEEYTSLLGIPIISLSDLSSANVEFTIETSYVEVSCSKVEYIDDHEATPGLTITCLDCGTATSPTNRTKAFLGPPFHGLSAAEKMNSSYTQPRTIRFNSTVVSGGNLPHGASQADCPITQRLVEVFIQCKKDDCAATKIRPSRIDHRGANFTSFDLWASAVLDMMSQASRAERRGSQVSLGASTSELFLNNSEILPLQRANNLFTREGAMMNLSAISADLFSVRASILLNTGLQAFMCPTGFAGNFSTNLDLYGPDHKPADGLITGLNKSSWSLDTVTNDGVTGMADDNVPFIAASTNATVTRHVEVYLPNYLWVVFLAISATFLFLMGLIGLVLRFATMAPNVFDPVMGLTYGNKYMSPPSRQSPLDAEKRLEVLADERIRLGYVDVDNNEMTAKTVFGEEARICPLTKKMRYY